MFDHLLDTTKSTNWLQWWWCDVCWLLAVILWLRWHFVHIPLLSQWAKKFKKITIVVVEDLFEFSAKGQNFAATENSKRACIILKQDNWHNAVWWRDYNFGFRVWDFWRVRKFSFLGSKFNFSGVGPVFGPFLTK